MPVAIEVKQSCERCGGDLIPESDQYGKYVYCLQCGDEPLDPDIDLEKLMEERNRRFWSAGKHYKERRGHHPNSRLNLIKRWHLNK